MSDFKKPKSSEMCPPGYHVVQGHDRTCESGTVTWVDAHIRKNRGKIKPGLLIENIHYLFWNSKKKYPPIGSIPQFKNGDQYDSVIQFWLEYWASQGVKFPDGLNALIVKALISVESGFDPKARSLDPKSTASGLTQVTDQMVRIIGGLPNKDGYIEARQNLIHVKYPDKLDPVVSTALGIRLLGHKYSQIPKGHQKNVHNTLKAYHQWNTLGEKYAEKVIKIVRTVNEKK
jgi:hypothetical protein